MLIHVDAHSGLPIYRQIMDQIRYQVLAGILVADDKLPSVRDLSSKLKVNPMTISKAYSFLEQEGLLVRQRGIGIFVAAIKRSKIAGDCEEKVRGEIRKLMAEAKTLGINGKRFIELVEKERGLK